MATRERTELAALCEEGTIGWTLAYRFPTKELAKTTLDVISKIEEKEPLRTQVFEFEVENVAHVIVVGVGKRSIGLMKEFDEACCEGEKYKIPEQIGKRLVIRHLLTLPQRIN